MTVLAFLFGAWALLVIAVNIWHAIIKRQVKKDERDNGGK